ncbi:FAH family protein [Pseudoxanthomonas helianthi]|uniref:FAH family protein n=1 Tax=Pseudoxanthomonas helianthi TaxID=1453541 RepID=A0A941AUQ1_9GAMM|nr:AraD1 family protein [Pseudoxanthomonas helianthi]MBP3983448.1 FAH family protein [Pseudoxanthomonas helianthi]
MRLIQFLDDTGGTRVGVVDPQGQRVQALDGVDSTYDLATLAIRNGRGLQQQAALHGTGGGYDYPQLLAESRVLTPLHHADPAHCRVTGTGLTHLGSASARDAMHQNLKQQSDAGTLTDSMRMFQWGVEGGIPQGDAPGAQPEWFYKGDGGIVAAPGAALSSPDFALDGSEEPELVGLYLIGPDRVPHRLGFAVGNEFSDHVTERQNYLYLAHSKLRACAIGPELRVGELPRDLRGTSRVLRDNRVLWEKPFLTGEANMCHSIANLEYHHFKYAEHRRPGDVHLHFFGTATLSFADGVRTEPGDVFEVELPDLGAPLRNTLSTIGSGFALHGVRAL